MNQFALFVGDQFVGELKRIKRAEQNRYDLTLHLSTDVPIAIYSGTEDETTLRPLNDPKFVMVRFDGAKLHTLEDPVLVDDVRIQITTSTVITEDDIARLQGDT